MAMTNKQIIEIECGLNGITENVNTYAGWQRLGFQVKKGSKALFTTEIWKPCKKKAATTDNEDSENEEDVKPKRQKMILVKAAFFGISQVEKLQTT